MAKNSSGVTGTVIFTETNGKVTMTANISGLAPRNHALELNSKDLIELKCFAEIMLN